MARKTTQKTIGDYGYVFTQFDPRKSLRILTKLGRYMGEPIAHVLGNKDPNKSLLDADMGDEIFGQAITKVFSSLGDDDLYVMAVDVCASVVLQTAPQGELTGTLKDAVFEDHFAGSDGLKRMFSVMKESLGVNYTDFLGDLVGNVVAGKEES